MNLQRSKSFVLKICSFLDTPAALSTWLLYRHGEWGQLSSRRWNPLSYSIVFHSPDFVRREKQAFTLLRKVAWHDPTISPSPREAAMVAWEEAESKCCSTNSWLFPFLDRGALHPSDDALRRFVDAVKKRMTRMFGPIPNSYRGKWGPGSVFEWSSRLPPTVADKFVGIPHVTSRAEAVFRLDYDFTSWSRFREQEGLQHLAIASGSRLSFVPKDGTTMRPIAIEPTGNLWCQLGIGSFLKTRLAKWGMSGFVERKLPPGMRHLPLSPDPDAAEIHRKMAKLGSQTGEWATIDLRSASDTISRAAVKAFLPPLWYELLDSLRTHRIRTAVRRDKETGGEIETWRYLEKFSSMGNGFTFELETMLFTALLEEACGLMAGKNLWVFGDDMIVPAHTAQHAIQVLTLFGFIVNDNKTFIEGPFRESCGGDYWLGVDVTSVALKGAKEIGNPRSAAIYVEGQALFDLHNSLLKWGIPFSCLDNIREEVPSYFRLYGPSDLAGVFHGHAKSSWKSCGQVNGLRRFLTTSVTVEKDQVTPLDRWMDQSHRFYPALVCLQGDRVVRRGAFHRFKRSVSVSFDGQAYCE